MFRLVVFVVLFSSLCFGNLPECHPDYDEWICLGAPISWTYPRQCRGDTDGQAQGSSMMGFRYVYTEDLANLVSARGVKESPLGPGLMTNELGADFDHRASGSPYTGYCRVGTNDCCILFEYYGVKEPSQGPGVPACDFTCPIENDVIDGPVLSLKTKLPGQTSFVPSSTIVTAPGTIEIGIANDSADKCTCYDGYISVTQGWAYGVWTGESWVYNTTNFNWTYFGTAAVPGMDTWYMKTINPTDIGDPATGTVSASVKLQFTGPGITVVKLYNEYFEEVDSLTIQSMVPEVVQVTSPNGGEVLMTGGSHDITWTDYDTIPTVDIDYSTDGGSQWNSVASSIENNGHYTWDSIPAANSNTCLVRVSGEQPETSGTSDNFFTIFTCSLAPIAGDLNNDCYVNLTDLAVFCDSWLVCGNMFDPLCN